MLFVFLLFHLLFTELLSIPPFDPEFYNVIDVTPNCYTMGLCTEYGEWGKSIYSVHPSSEERTLHLIRNMVRLFPTAYRNSKYGAREWGYKGSDAWTYDTEGFCNKATHYPAYWYSMGNQAARFHQYDKFTCNSFIGHESCSDPDRCSRFGSCSFSDRSRTFIPGPGIWGKSEGIYGMNNAWDGGHCSAVFDPDYKYFGVGYWPSMSSSTTLYIKNGPPRDYPIYMGSHLDETSRIPADYHNAEGKYLTFLLGWYGNADTINKRAESVYLLYDAQMIEMNVLFGDASSGVYEAHSVYPMNGCEPYAFVVIADDKTIYRLPEQSTYFYGTSWVELEKGVPNKPGIHYPECSENHYYRDERLNNQWIANGAQNLSAVHITYIKQNECVGCHKVNTLVDVYNANIMRMTGKVNTNSQTSLSPAQNPTISLTTPVTVAAEKLLGFCDTTGGRGYEISTNLMFRIRTETEEQQKEVEVQDYINEMIKANSECNNYDVSLQEEWVRTRRLKVTIAICFHCIEPVAALLNDAEQVHETVYWNIWRIALLTFLSVSILCSSVCFIKMMRKLKNTQWKDNNQKSHVYEKPAVPNDKDVFIDSAIGSPMSVISEESDDDK